MTLRQRQKEQTRLEIVQAATALFMERGIEDVAVEDICERAGISRATFFNYFPQKDLLLASLVLKRADHVRTVLEGHAGKGQPGSLEDVTKLFVEFAAENERMGVNAKHVLLAMLTRPACHDPHLEMQRQCRDAIAGYIRHLGRGADATLLAETLFSIYMGATVEWMLRRDLPAGWLTKAVKARLNVVIQGIKEVGS
jgi:AcrR family transcriptional regulator